MCNDARPTTTKTLDQKPEMSLDRLSAGPDPAVNQRNSRPALGFGEGISSQVKLSYASKPYIYTHTQTHDIVLVSLWGLS